MAKHEERDLAKDKFWGKLAAKVSQAICPSCGEKDLRMELRLVARPLGSFSLAGVGMKVSCREQPWLVCDSCGTEARGRWVPEQEERPA